jgi:hypothetical protein
LRGLDRSVLYGHALLEIDKQAAEKLEGVRANGVDLDVSNSYK